MTAATLNPREIRELLAMSQAEMAEELGLSQSQVSRIEGNPEQMRPWQTREYSRLAEKAARMAAKKADNAGGQS